MKKQFKFKLYKKFILIKNLKLNKIMFSFYFNCNSLIINAAFIKKKNKKRKATSKEFFVSQRIKEKSVKSD